MKRLYAVLSRNEEGYWDAEVIYDDNEVHPYAEFQGQLNEVCGWFKKLVHNIESIEEATDED